MHDMQFSISQIAAAMGADRKTIAKRLASTKPDGMRKGYPIFSLRSVIAALAASGPASLEHMNPYERRAWVASERDLLKLETERGNLLQAEDVREQFGHVGTIVVRCISTVADRLERDKRVGPAVVEYVANVMDDLRDEIAAAIGE